MDKVKFAIFLTFKKNFNYNSKQLIKVNPQFFTFIPVFVRILEQIRLFIGRLRN